MRFLIPFILFFVFTNSSFSSVSHDLRFEENSKLQKISPGEKLYKGQRDHIFVDAMGREAHFRGWNVSGAVKLGTNGFLPFRTVEDAKKTFPDLRKKTGSNSVRFLLSWEGTHPKVDFIDYAYLDRLVAQLKEAIKNNIYVYIDYHIDLFSRHLFDENHPHSGNGAPKWITPLEIYPDHNCKFCVHWGVNIFTNDRITSGYMNFWKNAPLPTEKGVRRMQDEFLWQLEKTLIYVKSKLTAEEFDYILGLDPMNEPSDGGRDGLTPNQFDNLYLWPFYERAKQVMNKVGWDEKFAMGEPVITWIFNSPLFNVTGGSHLDHSPGKGFVFNTHFYDTNRMGLNLTSVRSGTHLKYFDIIRRESRHFKAPPWLSEFGMPVSGLKGSKDYAKMLTSLYQSTELSYIGAKKRSHYPNLYGPLISSSQWHWDIYYDNHREYKNGNKNILISHGDGINNEDFSVVKDFGKSYTVDPYTVERSYPRRGQGPFMSFVFNSLAKDLWGTVLKWNVLRPVEKGEKYFENNRFSFLIWKGRTSQAPTEIFLPHYFSLSNTWIITEKRIVKASDVYGTMPRNTLNEIFLKQDVIGDKTSGKRLYVWDDKDMGESMDSLHFALTVQMNEESSYSYKKLSKIQKQLIERLNEGKSPIYLNTRRIKVEKPKSMKRDWVSPHLPAGSRY